jgi:hypothetical protein
MLITPDIKNNSSTVISYGIYISTISIILLVILISIVLLLLLLLHLYNT